MLHYIPEEFLLRKIELELNKCTGWRSYCRFSYINQCCERFKQYCNQNPFAFLAVGLPGFYSDHYLKGLLVHCNVAFLVV